MLKKNIFVFLSGLCIILSANAQSNNGYVYVTDKISASDFNKTIVKGQVNKNCKAYHIFLYNESYANRFSFDDNQRAIVTIQDLNSKAILRKINVLWAPVNVNNHPAIRVYGKATPYTSYTDLTDNDTFNDGQEITTFTLTDNNFQQEFNISYPEYQHIAFNKASNYTPYLESISLTWQLAYFRSDLTVGNLATICLPYDVKAEDMNGITAYSIAGKTIDANNTVTSIIFHQVDQIEAGKPYLVVANSNEIALKYYGDKTETPISDNGMYGVFDEHPFADDDHYDSNYYVIANNVVQAASSKSGVHANCAYIRMNEVPIYNAAQSSNRALVITGEGFTQTDITPILLNTPPSSEPSDNTFDLCGRRATNGIATAITITNGKKILVRRSFE